MEWLFSKRAIGGLFMVLLLRLEGVLGVLDRLILRLDGYRNRQPATSTQAPIFPTTTTTTTYIGPHCIVSSTRTALLEDGTGRLFGSEWSEMIIQRGLSLWGETGHSALPCALVGYLVTQLKHIPPDLLDTQSPKPRSLLATGYCTRLDCSWATDLTQGLRLSTTRA